LRRHRTNLQPNSRRNHEQGIVILLAAVFLLFVVGAMAALAIDVVTFYTARSEAQLAADAAALAGARVLANSGMTSDPNAISDGLAANAEILAATIATQVATHNQVGGRPLNAGEVTVSFNDTNPTFGTNPQVTVLARRTDIPTFFARWRVAQVTVQATATAEAYNPSGLPVGYTMTPVAPMCVKPWVLPNISPADNVSPIFNATTGAIQDPALIGWTDNSVAPIFYSRCTGSGGPPYSCIPWTNSQVGAEAWRYYPGQQSSFPEPTQALQSCGAAFQPYQLSIAGCVTRPIACNSMVDLDTTNYVLRNTQAAAAVNCLTHSENDQGDTVATSPPGQAFQFLAGNDNPIAGAISKNVLVSDSLVSVPVYNSTNGVAPPTPVQIIGFVQLFLNPDGRAAGSGNPPRIRTTIVNLVGCGTNATGQPVLGNGASPVPVRLVSSQ
jgi:hypothetical protein